MTKLSLSILLADDEPIVHKTIGDYLKELGHRITHAHDGNQAWSIIQKEEFDLHLLDVRMPGMDGMQLLQRSREFRPQSSVIIITAHGNLEMAVQALRLGAADFLVKPVKLLELDAAVLKSCRLAELRRDRYRLKQTISGIQSADDKRSGYSGFLGISQVAESVRNQIHQAVDSQIDTILLTGETGVGKEIVAREIHRLSCTDHGAPFIAVSCPALPESLIESELFGHTKGAFTGATLDRPGCFELADGGTLFLDEVADLSAAAQASLLRVLETRTLRRVGGAKEIHVNLRIIAASNVTLGGLVDQGKFRRDLFYRLHVFPIDIPPLRARRDDITLLADHFLRHFCQAKGLAVSGFDQQAIELLRNYSYPGNARELRNIIERAAVVCRQGAISPQHLYLPAPTSAQAAPPELEIRVDDERAVLLNALERAKWNRRLAATHLGMPYSTLRFKMQKLGIR